MHTNSTKDIYNIIKRLKTPEEVENNIFLDLWLSWIVQRAEQIPRHADKKEKGKHTRSLA